MRETNRSRIAKLGAAFRVLWIAPLLMACVAQSDSTFGIDTSAYSGANYTAIRKADGLVAAFTCGRNYTTTSNSGLVAERYKPGDTHYVEFRLRVTPALPSGHLHVVYGKLGKNRLPKTFNYVGLLPKGSVFGLYAGIFIPVGISGELEPSFMDCAVKPQSAYRVSLNANEFETLLNKIEQYRDNPPDWRMLSYNCNHFASDLGKTVGLKAPRGIRSQQFLSNVYFRQFLKANGEKPRYVPQPGRS